MTPADRDLPILDPANSPAEPRLPLVDPGSDLGSQRPLPSPDAQVPYTLRVLAGYAWRLVAVLLALWMLGQVVGAITSVLVSVFVGGVITALTLPLVNLLDKVMPRALAVAATIILTFVLVVGALSFITLQFINQIPQLSQQLQDGFNSFQEWLETGPLKLDAAQITQYLDQAREWVTSNAGNLATGVLGGLGTVGGLLTGLAVAVFAAVFFLYDGQRMWAWLVGTTPRRAQDRVDTSGQVAWQTFSGYARGTVIIALTNAILVGIALTILRVPLPIPLALLVFVGSFIPYVGAPIAMFLAGLVAFAANGIWSFVLVIILITLIGQLEGNVLQPLVMSKQVSLHPLVVIVGVIAGSASMGIIGAIVAVPVIGVVWSILRYLTGRDPDNPKAKPFTTEPLRRVAGDSW
ncbi:MAG: AI-2E family transporter [Actinomycetota bacterium]|nr:MAG: AI-2E family transporter [Actinomycetota bacterium]